MAILERHIAICPACREFAAGQRAVWQALDTWEAAPVSPDFDRRLYRRIEARGFLVGSAAFAPSDRHAAARPAGRGDGLPAGDGGRAAGASRGFARPARPATWRRWISVQPEQVEHTLDAMEMLNEFSHHVRSGEPGLQALDHETPAARPLRFLLLMAAVAMCAQNGNEPKPPKPPPPPRTRSSARRRGQIPGTKNPEAPKGGGAQRLGNPGNPVERLMAMPPEKREQVLEKLPPPAAGQPPPAPGPLRQTARRPNAPD